MSNQVQMRNVLLQIFLGALGILWLTSSHLTFRLEKSSKLLGTHFTFGKCQYKIRIKITSSWWFYLKLYDNKKKVKWFKYSEMMSIISCECLQPDAAVKLILSEKPCYPLSAERPQCQSLQVELLLWLQLNLNTSQAAAMTYRQQNQLKSLLLVPRLIH